MVGNLADGRISNFSNMFCLFYFFRWISENTGYFTHLIDVVFSLAFYYVLFLRGSFSVFASTPSPLLGVGISGICTGGFP